MKKSLFLLLMMCCSLSLFTSCSKDDDNTPSSANVVGTYNGPLGVNVNGVSSDAVNYPIVITATSNNTITLSIANFSFSSLNLGTFVIQGCNCTYTNGVYTLTGETSVKVNLSGLSIACPTQITGTISNDKAVLSITITVPGLNQTVVVTYTGDKSAA
jgi:hypothetical protein